MYCLLSIQLCAFLRHKFKQFINGTFYLQKWWLLLCFVRSGVLLLSMRKEESNFFYVKKLIFWIVWIHKGRYDSWISILCMWWTLSDVKDNKCRIMLTEHKCFSLKNSIHLSLENTVFRLHWSLVYLSLFNIILQHILKKKAFLFMAMWTPLLWYLLNCYH